MRNKRLTWISTEKLNPVDILLIAGDISPLDIQFNKEMMKKMVNWSICKLD